MRTGVPAAALWVLLLAPPVAPQDQTPALSKEVADLVRRYSAVAEWRGQFRSSETGAASWSANGGDHWGSYRVDRGSQGQFRIERNTLHWEPERGMLRWGGNNNQTTGEVNAGDILQVSQWSKWGDGSEQSDKTSGRVPLLGSMFELWLPSKTATVYVGGNKETLLFERVGRAVTHESRGNGTDRVKETSLDKVERVQTFYYPLSAAYFSSEKAYQVASGGPGVLTFACEGTARADKAWHIPELTHRSAVTLFPVYDDLEVEVTIKDYEVWMPRGSIPQPSQPGSHVQAAAVLVQKNGKGPPPKVKRFRFELLDVSREPGICMNWPRFGPDGDTPPAQDPEPDLRFAAWNGAVRSKEDLAAELPPVQDPKGRESATARIDSYDFGGTADLIVTCDLEDGREICGILRVDGRELLSIPLPYRRWGSRIAHRWQEQRKSRSADQDDDDAEPVGNGSRGDGFSAFEEYRGFVVNRNHVRTRQEQKDLFVVNHIGKKALPGLFLLADLTGLAVRHELRPDEMPTSRRMNVNRSASSPRSTTEYQCGVILDLIGGGSYSMAVIPQGQIGRPKNTDIVVILNLLLDPRRANELSSTIAHELLHSIGVLHHGDTDPRYVMWERVVDKVSGVARFEETPLESLRGTCGEGQGTTTIRILRSDGQEVRAQDAPGFLPVARKRYIGCYQGEHSGDVDCVMRYHCANAYRRRYGVDRHLSPWEPVGMKLCTAATGTQFNAPDPGGSVAVPEHNSVRDSQHDRYGDAKLGNCLKKFCVRDDAPAP